uniref:Uncharacterized protein n=1 Tax=Alexandrium andersonii TaxID=327968 RepID=A0A7S2AP14_9DINO
MAACIVLKYHSQESAIRLSDQQVMCTMLAAFSLHVFAHWLILFWIVPMCRRDHEDTPVDYATVSRETPCSWFSANPVHCLRSRYIHRHDPPCDHYFLGKEHLLKRNPKIGIYFESDAAAVSPRKEEGGRRAMDYWWMGHRRTSDASDDGGAVRADRPIGSSSWHRSGTSELLAAWLSPGSFIQTNPVQEAEQAMEVEGQEQLPPTAEESRLPEEGAGSAGSGQEARGS